uniref:Uncharacterized protein n=1 Tax=Amphimedon queenslandica TaxID=400682 RepID=A0A1X7VRW4_AMPQE
MEAVADIADMHINVPYLTLEQREAMLNVDQKRIFDKNYSHLISQKECENLLENESSRLLRLDNIKPLRMFISGVGGTGYDSRLHLDSFDGYVIITMATIMNDNTVHVHVCNQYVHVDGYLALNWAIMSCLCWCSKGSAGAGGTAGAPAVGTTGAPAGGTAGASPGGTMGAPQRGTPRAAPGDTTGSGGQYIDIVSIQTIFYGIDTF